MDKRKMKRKKSLLLIFSLTLMLVLVTGTTLAYLISHTEDVTNTFKPSEVTSEVEEDLEEDVKKNVRITNTGDTEAYIRAFVVVTWQDGEGNVSSEVPVEGKDYNVVFDLDDGWELSKDGFYYWTEPVDAKASTDVLIESCSPIEEKAPQGYSLNVEIIGSAIQSVPANVVTTEWSSGVSGVSADGTLTIKK